MNYRVEYYIKNQETLKREEQPMEVHWFQRPRLSRRDINNMLLACTMPGRDISGFIYRNDQYIGMVNVIMNDMYKFTTVIMSGRMFFKHQWFDIYRERS